jgi:hypothetical protein
MKPDSTIPAALCLLLLPCLQLPAETLSIYEDAYNWAHPNTVTVAEGELLIRLPDSPHYRARSYAFVARLNDGNAFTVNLFEWVFGSMGTWGLTVQAANPTGEIYHFDEKIPAESLVEARDHFSIRFGNGDFEQENGEQRVRLDLPDFSCDLRIRSILAPWKPGDGFAYFSPRNDEYLHLLLAAPLASVSGSMRIRGKTIQAEGWCTGSRSLTVLPLSKLTTEYFGWQVFSSIASPEPWFLELHNYEAREAQNQISIPMLVLAHGSRWVLTSKEYSLTPEDFVEEPGIPHPYPKRLRIHSESEGYMLDGYFTTVRVIRYQDVFHSLPKLLAEVASLFHKSPVIFRLFGEFQGTLRTPSGKLETLNLNGLGSYSTFK